MPHVPLANIAWAPLALMLLLLAGCLEKTLVWSPDGSHAAVIGPDGLYLCDAGGKLTGLLAPDVYLAAWLGDSQQLVLARSRKTGSWNEIARAIGPETADALMARAEAVWQQVQKDGHWSVLTMDVGGKERAELMKIYLRERYGEALQAKVEAGEWDDIKNKQAGLYELTMTRMADGKVTPGTRLHEGLGKIREIRLAPGDRAVAFVTETVLTPEGKTEDDLHLWLARVDGSGATPVAAHVGAFPDWTPDGRSLAYVQAMGGSAKDDLRLGSLVRREVLDASGKIAVKDEKKELAGWIFSDNSRVRCLRDGRILFNAAEISLPIAAEDYGEQHEQLFAVDPARQATLVRLIPRKQEEDLPQTLAFFEVSPDEKQVLFGAFDGSVSLLTLATGEVEQVQEGVSKQNLQGQPVWRKDGEFSYTSRVVQKDGPAPVRKAEVVLRSGGKVKTLSADWPDQMVNHLVSDRN
ncbi:MAG: hypothetical protein HYV75_02450 [Opitutae bacterium]|nr:hypothetical protein [Opitutae bacterium]